MTDKVLNSKEGLLFLTYLTRYNINAIYKAVEDYSFETIQDFYYNFISAGLSYNGDLSHANIQREIDKAWWQTELNLAKLSYYGIRIISYTEKGVYPQNLKSIRQPPPLLYAKGHLRDDISMAAVIGTRQISKYAKKLTQKTVSVLTSNNYGILSGLAIGIDTFAHMSALENNAYTIAVMPNSLDTIYPKENFSLAVKILEKGGALISELAPEINRGKKSFVERNRIQSGLSEIVIPLELGTKSGTMHTVNFAKSQNKHIVIVQPYDQTKNLPQYEGILTLIDQQSKKPFEKFHLVPDSLGLQNILHTLPKYKGYSQTNLFDQFDENEGL